MNLKQKTTKQLKELASSLHYLIFDIECYGVKDLILYDQVLNELESRNYKTITYIKFKKIGGGKNGQKSMGP